MSNLNGLRQLISLAMRDGHKTVTIPLDNASMIVVEYESSQVAADNAKKAKKSVIVAVDEIISIIDDSFDDLTEEEAKKFLDLIEAYRSVRGTP